MLSFIPAMIDDPAPQFLQSPSVSVMDFIRKEVKALSCRSKVEKEFYNSFKKFLWANQIFCAAPVKLNLFSHFLDERRKIDKILSAAHLFWGFLISASVCLATYLQRKEFDTSMGFMTSVLYMAEYILGTFNLLLVIVGCQYQLKYYRIFFRRLVEVDINLQKCGIQPNFDTTNLYLRRSVVVYAIFFAGVIVVDFMYNKMHGESFARSSTVYTVPNVVSTLALTQYSTVLHFIRDKFNTINAVLRRLIRKNSCKDLHQQANNKLNIISILSMNFGRNDIDRILNVLRKQHAELSRLIELLNKCFGLLIVLTLIAAYVILSIQFYAFYKMTEGFEASDGWLIVYTILWVILHGGKVFLVLYPINDISDERKRTGNLLFQIEFSDRNSNNESIVFAVKNFADQLLHETSPPNALRVIHLDLTIVGTMLGVLATYLIILIQFDASTRNQNNFNNITNAP